MATLVPGISVGSKWTKTALVRLPRMACTRRGEGRGIEVERSVRGGLTASRVVFADYASQDLPHQESE